MALSPAAGHANNPRVVMKDLEELREAKLHTALRFLESKQTGLSPSILHACMHACMHCAAHCVALAYTLHGAFCMQWWKFLTFRPWRSIPGGNSSSARSGSTRNSRSVCINVVCIHAFVSRVDRESVSFYMHTTHVLLLTSASTMS